MSTEEQERLAHERLERWKQRLQNLNELQLPTDYPRPSPAKVVEAVKKVTLTEATSIAILQLSRPSLSLIDVNGTNNGNTSPFIILLAAFSILLYRYTGVEDIAVGSSSGSRNPLVLRIPISPTDTFEQVVQKVHQVEGDATADEIPFQSLLSSISHSPLFRVRFFDQTDIPDKPLLQATSSTTDLTVLITSHSSLRQALFSIEISISYNQVLFSEKRISHIFSQLITILDSVVGNNQLTVAQIPIISKKCREVLPDPRSDLKWDEFQGAITDIFASNAKKFPDRSCVIESRADSDENHIFTYRHIYEASNLVARYLIRNGIEREDVVMIYAYRGVDLVVAIMGVLKAGATFSVIDPAYPPDRQNIYLSVAVPRGIILLKRTGTLHPSVRAYIQENLEIKCEIPALEIADDGFLRGGEVVGGDALDSIRNADDVNVVIGPDSIGTLSFTSGSTGIPKGVRGRHFSLTHYYPWMSKEFGLSDKDKFTMLSGIAHDPVQRDIFTPLFLGAELHIPTSEDIGVPGRLATWMAEHEVTITHLTPAMGQLLAANADTPIPSLRNAFFVGDILTRRDCNRLQHLARNTNIINMYGTTETQRSVSYFTIPSHSSFPSFLSSQKDVIPAGKGMQNVQLLVVNRQKKDILCGVGEIGEIYGRAGGLAESYLKLDNITREKFVNNWFCDQNTNENKGNEKWGEFWKGKRDRLYKTGDLGRYMPDGNVECSGRADDQVKIRGFRIELSEIDTYLSQHPNVRENVTLVRRDKYEEQTLVSYFVPMKGDDQSELISSTEDEDEEETPYNFKYRRLVKKIKEYLKTKLPSYSVPSVIVPLKKMPLTPNGKIDKPALPFPDTAEQSTKIVNKVQQMTSTEQQVHEIWTRLLPNSVKANISLDESFFDLGGHSILATRLIFELRKTCNVSVPLGLVFEKPTIRGQAKEVENILSSEYNIAVEETDTEELDTANEGKFEDIREDKLEFDYASDYESLVNEHIERNYEPIPENYSRKTFFVTGVTGFLGAFILSTLLDSSNDIKLIAHVRSTSKVHAMEKVKKSCQSHLVWRNEWETQGRLEVICGNLEEDRLGIEEKEWESLAERVDVVIHNGALVHWVFPYSKLKATNVLGTVWALKLASTHHTKPFNFVSSTSVLDTEHYVDLSGSIVERGGQGIYEDDDLEGSRRGLRSGYGQSKWVAEKLIMEASKRGMPATIIRPGYIVGHSKTGVTNTDDFIWRLIKGCVQLGLVPTIHNTVNMCPVDYVAECVVRISLSSTAASKLVFHITHPPDPSFMFDELFNCLYRYGYTVTETEYIVWRDRLMELTLQAEDNALYPLLYFVLDDLPTSTKSPELDNSNTREITKIECERMGERLIGIYLGYLVKVGFLDKPDLRGKVINNNGVEILDLPDVVAALEGVEVLKRNR
ncbi:large subunit of L-aminoadipate-semialdehyde dehydrogenase [Rhizophagus irregularis]|uniref:Alpha-aminoadipate reductase n=1 Tax=Rhizophagus irregularis TaxID=588596 RepID=A0A2I1G935_9GLOM|nr:large subunit of L-aminoadipate-semialdehyde dehydrogenase [Rhizophagus irregularis]